MLAPWAGAGAVHETIILRRMMRAAGGLADWRPPTGEATPQVPRSFCGRRAAAGTVFCRAGLNLGFVDRLTMTCFYNFSFSANYFMKL